MDKFASKSQESQRIQESNETTLPSDRKILELKTKTDPEPKQLSDLNIDFSPNVTNSVESRVSLSLKNTSLTSDFRKSIKATDKIKFKFYQDNPEQGVVGKIVNFFANILKYIEQLILARLNRNKDANLEQIIKPQKIETEEERLERQYFSFNRKKIKKKNIG